MAKGAARSITQPEKNLEEQIHGRGAHSKIPNTAKNLESEKKTGRHIKLGPPVPNAHLPPPIEYTKSAGGTPHPAPPYRTASIQKQGRPNQSHEQSRKTQRQTRDGRPSTTTREKNHKGERIRVGGRRSPPRPLSSPDTGSLPRTGRTNAITGALGSRQTRKYQHVANQKITTEEGDREAENTKRTPGGRVGKSTPGVKSYRRRPGDKQLLRPSPVVPSGCGPKGNLNARASKTEPPKKPSKHRKKKRNQPSMDHTTPPAGG